MSKIKEKVIFTVNDEETGKVLEFENREEAEEFVNSKEEEKAVLLLKHLDVSKYELLEKVAQSMVDVIEEQNILSNIVLHKNNLSTSIQIKPNMKLLHPEWFVDKPFNRFFTNLLDDLNISYSCDEGDERRPSVFYIIPSGITDVPDINFLMQEMLRYEKIVEKYFTN